MAGSGQVVAYRFKGEQTAEARILKVPMIIAIAVLCVVGVVGCVCVPALPGGFPERRFDAYTWLVASRGDGLVVEGTQLGERALDGRDGGNEVTWRPKMTMAEIEREFGSSMVRYRFAK
jgi:hypothetical protein